MIIGIDLGGMSAKAACLRDGTLTKRVCVETSGSDTAEETAKTLASLARRAAEAAGIPYGEVEAIGIGIPLASVGEHLPGPDGADLPIRHGSTDAVVDAVLADLRDPRVASAELGGRDWALRWHTADRYVPQLEATYRRILG